MRMDFLVGTGYLGAGKRAVVDHAPPLLPKKEKSFLGVQPRDENRATDREAKVVVAQWRTSQFPEVIKEIVCRENVVAEEFVGATMKSVGAGSCDDIDLASRSASELRIVVAAQDLEFRN